MKAIRIHRFGGPDVLQLDEIDRPEPASGELLVHVTAAAVNPVDWEIREGMLQDVFHHQLPITLGCDLAGKVEAVGPDSKVFQVGDSVYAFAPTSRLGAFANYCIVKEEEAARKPEKLDDAHAASVPVAALTAWEALFTAAGLESGQTVLIHAASGGVGSMAVQLAKWKGAHVIGTASSKNKEYLDALGVDEMVDYHKHPFESVVHKKVDVVLDTIGKDTQERSFQVLKPGGMLVSLVSPPSEEKAKEYNVRAKMILVRPEGDKLAEVGRLIDDGRLKTLVEHVLPLEDAKKALDMSQTGRTRGKIVLRVA